MTESQYLFVRESMLEALARYPRGAFDTVEVVDYMTARGGYRDETITEATLRMAYDGNIVLDDRGCIHVVFCSAFQPYGCPQPSPP